MDPHVPDIVGGICDLIELGQDGTVFGKVLRPEDRTSAPLLIFLINGVHVGTVEMAPLEGPEGGSSLRSSGSGLHWGSGFVTVRLSAVDEYAVAGSKVINLSGIGQPAGAREDGEKQAGVQTRTFIFVRVEGLQGAGLLQVDEGGTGEGGGGK